MDITKGFFIIILMTGIILLIVYFVINKELQKSCDNKVVYKYLPRTLEQEQENPQFVSQIFKAMFTQPSVWINNFDENWQRKTEPINKYNISQS